MRNPVKKTVIALMLSLLAQPALGSDGIASKYQRDKGIVRVVQKLPGKIFQDGKAPPQGRLAIWAVGAPRDMAQLLVNPGQLPSRFRVAFHLPKNPLVEIAGLFQGFALGIPCKGDVARSQAPAWERLVLEALPPAAFSHSHRFQPATREPRFGWLDELAEKEAEPRMQCVPRQEPGNETTSFPCCRRLSLPFRRRLSAR